MLFCLVSIVSIFGASPELSNPVFVDWLSNNMEMIGLVFAVLLGFLPKKYAGIIQLCQIILESIVNIFRSKEVIVSKKVDKLCQLEQQAYKKRVALADSIK